MNITNYNGRQHIRCAGTQEFPATIAPGDTSAGRTSRGIIPRAATPTPGPDPNPDMEVPIVTDRVDPATVIADTCGAYMVPGRRYPRPLPPELEPWYLYIADGGHSVLIAVDGTPGSEVPAPVKAVLRAGWTLTPAGYVHCELPYDPKLGLITDPDDVEYDDEPDSAAAGKQLYKYKVGELYSSNRTQWPDGGMRWTLSEDGVSLVLFFAAPTDVEVTAVRTGAARFALLAGEHALILAHRFTPLRWSDSPWQAVRQTNATAGLALVGPDGRLIVTVYLVDANTGITAAIRVTTWSARFVEAVRTAIRTQSLNRSTEAQGATEIDAWYRRYSTTDQLVAAANLNIKG